MSITWKKSCTEMIHGVCPLCGADDKNNIYNTENFTGAAREVVQTVIVMCNQCGFVYTDPKPSFSKIKDFYEFDPHSSGHVYHDRKKGSLFEKVATKRGEYILRHSIPKNGRFFDIGCGKGDLLIWLKMNSNLELIGLDPSNEVFEIENDFGIEVIHSTFEHADLSSNFGKVDAISLTSVLEHVYDPVQLLKKIKSILKPDGFLFIEVPDITKARPALVEAFDYEHLSHFTIASLQDILHKVGMNIHDIDKHALTEGRIRICAVSSQRLTTFDAISGYKSEILRDIRGYEQKKRAIEKAFVSRIKPYFEKWKELHSRVAIYGAGEHTYYMLRLIDMSDFVCCVIDSDKKKYGKKFMKWPIYGPAHIDTLNLDAILISSHAFEEEIYESIKHFQTKGLDIITCYSQHN